MRGADVIKPVAIMILTIGLGTMLAGSTAGGDLTIHVSGVRNATGNIRFALHDKPDQFPKGNHYDGMEVAAQNDRVTVVFKGLPPGAYALAIHHDEDNDDEMDTVLFGIPQEGYGFSNDAKVIFSPPAFEAAAFDVPIEDTEIFLRIRY